MYLIGIKTYFELMRNLKKSLAQLKSEQWQSFCNIVRYAYKNVPFYRELYKKAGISPNDLKTPEDLRYIPITNKRMFQGQPLESLLAGGEDAKKLVSKRTSGSSGFPFFIYYTPEDRIYRTLLYLRILFFNGMILRDHTVQICDKRNVPGYQYMFQRLGFLPKDFIYCVQSPSRLLEELTAINPDVIYSYTSSLVLIANEIIRRGSCPIKPKLIFTTGELLNFYDQGKIKEAFSMRPRDLYGVVEMADVAWQCPQIDGYHINVDSCLLEVFVDGRPAEPGESGRVVATNLHSRAMPFIRYQIDDVVTAPKEEPCPCGCNFPRIEMIEGRADDWLFAPDGRRISPMDITVARARGIHQYRVIQKAYNYLVAELIPGEGFNDETIRVVAEHLEEVMGEGVRIDIQIVDQIPYQSGKLRSIFCDIGNRSTG